VFVIDASIALAIILNEDTDQPLTALRLSLVRGEAVAPDLLRHEVSNALIMAHRRGRIRAEEQLKALISLSEMPLMFAEASPIESQVKVMALAAKHTLSGYDAAYLEIAVARDIPLASLDKKLRSAASHSRVPVLPPKLA
jgi:predicted nucleic acid-binding protein